MEAPITRLKGGAVIERDNRFLPDRGAGMRPLLDVS